MQGFRCTKYFAHDQRLAEGVLIVQQFTQRDAAGRSTFRRGPGTLRLGRRSLPDVRLGCGECHCRNGRDFHLRSRISHRGDLWNGSLRFDGFRRWRDLPSIWLRFAHPPRSRRGDLRRGRLHPSFIACGCKRRRYQRSLLLSRRWFRWRCAAGRQTERLHKAAHPLFLALVGRQRLPALNGRESHRRGAGAVSPLAVSRLANVLHQPFAEGKQADENYDTEMIHGQMSVTPVKRVG